jgi:hypothetical protein
MLARLIAEFADIDLQGSDIRAQQCPKSSRK